MRWDALFSDLEAQARASERADIDVAATEMLAAEAATVELTERIAATFQVVVVTRSGEAIEGQVATVARQWILLSSGASEILIPTASIDHVRGLERLSRPLGSVSLQSLSLGSVLRTFARNRFRVGVRSSSTTTHGAVIRVGKDWVELATDQGQVVIPMAAVMWVRSHGG